MKRVLVIKNERSISKKIVSGLSQEGCFDLTLHNENEGLRIVFEQHWDIIILDWDDLSIPGTEICRQIRMSTMIPVIILTDNVSSQDCIAGLQAGADDYIRKPFVIEELIERIKVILRRGNFANLNTTNFYYFRDIFIDEARNLAIKNGENLSLTQREYELLLFLIKNKNSVLSRELILNQVWGYEVVVNPNVVDLYVGYLRKKINCEKSNRYIQTVHGRGYAMLEQI
jgi:DNA-binding response OmpR family regulator